MPMLYQILSGMGIQLDGNCNSGLNVDPMDEKDLMKSPYYLSCSEHNVSKLF